MGLEWVARILPARPKPESFSTMMRLRKSELADRCWAAEITSEESLEMAAEAWARCAELVEMLEGKRVIDHDLIGRLNEHRAHVVACKLGSCEHEYASLVRAELEGGR